MRIELTSVYDDDQDRALQPLPGLGPPTTAVFEDKCGNPIADRAPEPIDCSLGAQVAAFDADHGDCR